MKPVRMDPVDELCLYLSDAEKGMIIERACKENQSLRGAYANDIVDMALNNDAHLDVTEPLFEQMHSSINPDLKSYVCAAIMYGYYIYGKGVKAAEVSELLSRLR